MGSSDYVVKIGESADPALVGGKGASLSRMRALGLRVPDGLTITTKAWHDWHRGTLAIDTLYNDQVKPVLDEMIPKLGKGQMVSVRSGAAQSMPGMMETVLNVGANTTQSRTLYLMSLIKARELDESVVQEMIDSYLIRHNTFFLESVHDYELVEALADYAGVSLEDSVHQHIIAAIELVFQSWDSAKAKAYRKAKKIPNDLGTACTIQLMIDGSNGLTGVMLTRGEIDWLPEVQGNAIVDGSHKVKNRLQLADAISAAGYKQLIATGAKLEKEYGDAVDVEFTHDGYNMYYLQCRVAKRTPVDAMRIAVQLYEDGIYTQEQVMAVPVVEDSTSEYKVTQGTLVGSGIPINGKLIKGRASIDPAGPVSPGDIVFREITTTSDIDLMLNCAAVVTLVGGPSCHAALVARELNTSVVVGVGGIIVKSRSTAHGSSSKDQVYVWASGDHRIQHGDIVTILPDGSVYTGEVEFSQVTQPGEWSVKLAELQEEIAGGDAAEAKRIRKPRKSKTKYETTPTVELIPF